MTSPVAPADFDDDAELRPDFEDLSAATTWHAVLDSLRQHETSHHKHCLHLTAVRAALGKERRLKLPAALLAPFQVLLHPQQEPFSCGAHCRRTTCTCC